MTTESELIIESIHPALNPDSEATRVIHCTPSTNGWISINDQTCILYPEDATPIELPLLTTSITDLIAGMTGMGGVLWESDWADVMSVALVPIELSYTSGAAFYLDAYTSNLWRVVRPIAATVQQATTDLLGIVAQTDIRVATDAWIDVWGQVWDIERIAGESDSAYRQRIIYTLTSPRSNNLALEQLILQALGLSANVVDDSNSPFTLDGLVPGRDTWGAGDGGVWGPVSYGTFTVTIESQNENYSYDQLIALIRRYKAAGMGFTLTTTYSPLAQVNFADITSLMEDE